jgi:hypothetical protein
MLFIFFIATAVTGATRQAQHTPEVAHAPAKDYGPEFFNQLGRMFEGFTNESLRHVFSVSRPIQCSDLVQDQTEWRMVAFFSGREKFGNWYRENVNEVKTDRAVYIFTGDCRDPRSPVQVTTKVPVEPVPREKDGKVNPEEIQIKSNPPVKATFLAQTKAYTFTLPYLFHGKDDNGGSVYTFYPQRLADHYVTNVTSKWECKEVAGEYGSYRFLICHTQLFDLEPVDAVRSRDRDKPLSSWGTSTYAILSDGRPIAQRREPAQ